MFCLRFSFGHWEKSGEARRGCFLRSGLPSRGPYNKILALPGLGSFVSIRMQHACMYVRTFVCMPLCMSVSMYVRMHVFMNHVLLSVYLVCMLLGGWVGRQVDRYAHIHTCMQRIHAPIDDIDIWTDRQINRPEKPIERNSGR